jgi:hypothetical protein
LVLIKKSSIERDNFGFFKEKLTDKSFVALGLGVSIKKKWFSSVLAPVG